MMSERPVVVVGAGLAGLAAATELARAGLVVLVVDQAQAAGGAEFGVGIDLQALGDEIAVLQEALAHLTSQRDAARLAQNRAAPGARATEADPGPVRRALYRFLAAPECRGDRLSAVAGVGPHVAEFESRPGARGIHPSKVYTNWPREPESPYSD